MRWTRSLSRVESMCCELKGSCNVRSLDRNKCVIEQFIEKMHDFSASCCQVMSCHEVDSRVSMNKDISICDWHN